MWVKSPWIGVGGGTSPGGCVALTATGNYRRNASLYPVTRMRNLETDRMSQNTVQVQKRTLPNPLSLNLIPKRRIPNLIAVDLQQLKYLVCPVVGRLRLTDIYPSCCARRSNA